MTDSSLLTRVPGIAVISIAIVSVCVCVGVRLSLQSRRFLAAKNGPGDPLTSSPCCPGWFVLVSKTCKNKGG